MRGDLCLGIEFINYAQARQLEVTKGQGGDAGSVAKYSEFTLTVKVHGTRGMLPKLKSGMRKGVYVESRYVMLCECVAVCASVCGAPEERRNSV